MFFKCKRIPLAALGSEEVASIDVDGAGQLVDRINDRMDDVGAERLGIADGQRLGSRPPRSS